MTSELSPEKEFIVNDHITLRLENGYTILYVDNEKFRQCMELVIQIPKEVINEYDTISTIDEAAKLNKKLFKNKLKYSISPEQEFWGHCSNLQTWIENDYDTRLIHSNLAFPLLKRLVEAGDSKAQKSFKREIALSFERWLESAYSKLSDEFFTIHTYLDYLTNEEQYVLFRKYADKYYACLNEDQSEIIIRLSKLIRKPIPIITPKNRKHYRLFSFGIKVEEKKVVALALFGGKTPKVVDYIKLLDAICELTTLEEIDIEYNQIKVLPDSIKQLSNLKKLNLSCNKLEELPASIGNLKSLKELNLRDNELKKLPDSIKNLYLLEILILDKNPIRNLPVSIAKLKSIRELYLINIHISELPYWVGKLKTLEKLIVNENNLKTLPNSLMELNNLREIGTKNMNIGFSLPNSLNLFFLNKAIHHDLE